MALQLPRECAGNNLAFEMQRVSYTYNPGGGLSNQDSGLRLPGSRSPDLRMMEQPEAIQQMCTTYADAARYGSSSCAAGAAPGDVGNFARPPRPMVKPNVSNRPPKPGWPICCGTIRAGCTDRAHGRRTTSNTPRLSLRLPRPQARSRLNKEPPHDY